MEIIFRWFRDDWEISSNPFKGNRVSVNFQALPSTKRNYTRLIYYNFKRHRWPKSFFFHQSHWPISISQNCPQIKYHLLVPKSQKKSTLFPRTFESIVQIVGETIRDTPKQINIDKRCRNRSPRTGIADFQSTTRPRPLILAGIGGLERAQTSRERRGEERLEKDK